MHSTAQHIKHIHTYYRAFDASKPNGSAEMSECNVSRKKRKQILQRREPPRLPCSGFFQVGEDVVLI